MTQARPAQHCSVLWLDLAVDRPTRRGSQLSTRWGAVR